MSQIVGDFTRAFVDEVLTGAGNGTADSAWIPTDTAAELCLWFEQSGTTVGVTIDIWYSPWDAKYMNDATVTTEMYIATNLITAHTGEIMVRYTPTDKAVLAYPPRSCMVRLTEAGTDDSTVNVWLEKRG